MLSLTEIELSNFRSWKNLYLTDFNKRGLCCIQGDNGSGKSSIRQAIEYLLTDKISDGIDLEELPRDKDKECYIRCILYKDQDKIEIVKYRNHKKFGNKIILLINGDDTLTCSNRKDTQKNIEQVLGINQESLLASTIFSQFSQSFPESSESERKNVLYEFLSLNKYKKYQEEAKKTFEIINNHIVEQESELSYTKRKIQEVCVDIKFSHKRFNSFSDEKRTAIAKSLVELDSLVEQSDTEVQSNLKQNELMLVELNKDDLLKELHTRKTSILNNKSMVERDLYLYKDKSKSIRSNTCPILDQACEILQTKIIELNDKYQPIINSLEHKLELINDDLKIIEDDESKFELERDTERKIQSKVQELKEQLREIRSYNDNIKVRREAINQAIETLSKQENPYTLLIEENKAKLIALINQMKSLKKEIKINKEQVPYIEFWVEGFSRNGIPNLKVEGTLDKLESLTNSYLVDLGRKMSVEIRGQKELKSGDLREQVSYKIHHHNKAITDYHSFSGGEKQRIKLADLLAFNDLLSQLDIMILDEVLELSLDSSGKDSVVDLLKQRAKEKGSIYIISHSGVVQDKVDSLLNIRNVNGISEIV